MDNSLVCNSKISLQVAARAAAAAAAEVAPVFAGAKVAAVVLLLARLAEEQQAAAFLAQEFLAHGWLSKLWSLLGYPQY